MEGVGENIKKHRLLAGLTQQELADKLRQAGELKTTRATIGRWEADAQDMGMTTLTLLAKIFDTTLNELAGINPVNDNDDLFHTDK